MRKRLLTDEQLDWLAFNIDKPLSYLARELGITEYQVDRQITNRIGERKAKVYRTRENWFKRGGGLRKKWDFSGENLKVAN